ncbi:MULTISPECIES: penicillin acylase family protein [Flavobacteriaceae]|uniref:Penicillin acylase family protein n=2 Tax=Flavobacteriaceae TaxID=49546 RepID=A0A4Y8APX4_9FLAO|nr:MULTISPECIES: penicillin acylase family protein [Flavobacteriaceae]TEW72858.1 penicillin acylase family protein [Gramella jeungdoensis]GGK49081.1 penicillin amidase [Lutibacter litoralis]
MKVLKKILLFIVVLVVLVIICSLVYFNSLKPKYSGELELVSIENKTDVYFDEYGIPHIYAENEQDAMVALGYVHAQDRLWQMELIRRIAPGRLSEIFGEDMLKNDKFFTSLGIEEASQKSIEKLDVTSEVYQLTTAYLKGVNQFIDNGATPIEFTLIGINKEHYQLKDIYNILGYMSFSFAMAHKTDPLLSAIKEKLGANYLKDLNIDVDSKTALIKNSKSDIKNYANIVASVSDIMKNSPVAPFVGSNSWVVSANKTSTGNVLFANDPHIVYSQPGTWYEAHIVTPNYEMYGYHIAGVPFPLLGHNRNYAYGLTMFENDDVDFYKEENHPSEKNKYKSKGGILEYTIVNKTIKVKDAEAVVISVRNSHHGPIVNDVLDGISQTEPIAMSWVYTQQDGVVLDALHTISRATNMEDVKKGASMIHAPGLNIMFGDASGNVAWWAAGKLYKIKSNSNRKFILDGASGEDDIVEYLDFSENPIAENPEWNFVYSANNQPDTISNTLYPGYYLPEDRAKRIVELLEPKNNWNKETMATMINDVTSSVAPEVIQEFTKILDYNSFSKNEQRAIDVLQLWDGSNTIDNVAPTIYNKWIYLYLKNTFEDELGEQLFTQLMSTHLIKRTIADLIKNDAAIWWDNVATENVFETRKDILSESLIETVTLLEKQLGKDIKDWNWGKVHTLEHPHPLGTIAALKKYFNVGPFPIKGAREVIDNRGYEYNDSGLYNVNAGPSTRRIVDFSDIENSISILPTGQSGNPFSKHYKDQAEMYNKGEFRKMKLNKEEIINSSTKLTIQPKNE